jgi:hypothetical protein
VSTAAKIWLVFSLVTRDGPAIYALYSGNSFKGCERPHVDEGRAMVSLAALAHGRVRSEQGYSAAMLVEESRILQVCIFKTLRTNLSALDLSLVLTDVMTIADEVDSQLKQTMASFSDELARSHAAASW